MNKLLLGLLLSSFMLQAAENLQFKGTLIEPPICIINNNEVIEVDFANVSVDRIDGNNFKKLVPVNVICNSWDNSLTLTFSGTPSGFNDAAIVTDVNGLGIELRQNSKPFVIGSSLKVSVFAMPKIEAVPVKKNGATLQEGDFEAWATFQVDYQ